VGYSTKIGDVSLTLKGKYTHEFQAKRRLEGDFAQISIAVGF
jgi:hypothetical protein